MYWRVMGDFPNTGYTALMVYEGRCVELSFAFLAHTKWVKVEFNLDASIQNSKK